MVAEYRFSCLWFLRSFIGIHHPLHRAHQKTSVQANDFLESCANLSERSDKRVSIRPRMRLPAVSSSSMSQCWKPPRRSSLRRVSSRKKERRLVGWLARGNAFQRHFPSLVSPLNPHCSSNTELSLDSICMAVSWPLNTVLAVFIHRSFYGIQHSLRVAFFKFHCFTGEVLFRRVTMDVLSRVSIDDILNIYMSVWRGERGLVGWFVRGNAYWHHFPSPVSPLNRPEWTSHIWSPKWARVTSAEYLF